nr:hypothetical protein [Tanacetum cinerariifolium]
KNVSESVSRTRDCEGENEFDINTKSNGNDGSISDNVDSSNVNVDEKGNQSDCNREVRERQKDRDLNDKENNVLNDDQSRVSMKDADIGNENNIDENSINKKD